MVEYKDYIKGLFLGKRIHFIADCIVKIDIVGTVVDVERSNAELIYVVDSNGKIVRIGENTSKLLIELL